MTTQKILNNVTGQDTHAQRVCQLVKTIVANYYELPMDSYKSKSRVRQVIKLKQATVWFIRKLLPKATLIYIGKQMGYDHATVLHCLRKVADLLETNDVETVEDIRKIGDMVDLKNKSVVFGANISKDFYHINLNKCTSIKLPNGQGMVFSGMLPTQVAVVREFLERHYAMPLEVRKHTNTGLFILERLREDDGAVGDAVGTNTEQGKDMLPTTEIKSDNNDKEKEITGEETQVSLPPVQESGNEGK